jgi:hypothetical protein
MSKGGQRMLQEALETKVLQLRKSSSGVLDLKKKRKSSFVIHSFTFRLFNEITAEEILFKTLVESHSNVDQGPVDFRKALRKTEHGATDSLRKRDNWSSQEN